MLGILVTSSKMSSFAMSGIGASMILPLRAALGVGFGFSSTWIGLSW
jgi:hypothetical protein